MNCQSARSIDDWFATDLGRRLLNAEMAVLHEILPHLFGYHLVQIGGIKTECLLVSSRIMHRCLLHTTKVTQSFNTHSQVCANLEALPFISDCIDVVVLPHVLEFSPSPYAILQEVERILIPEGHLVIIGFNLLSFWGGWRFLTLKRHSLPWCGHFLSLLRLREWLGLLGFSLASHKTFFFLPPINHENVLKYTVSLEKIGSRLAWHFGAVYVVVAKKRVATLTPLRPKWYRPKTGLSIPKIS